MDRNLVAAAERSEDRIGDGAGDGEPGGVAAGKEGCDIDEGR